MTGGNLNGNCVFREEFYGLSDIPTKCREKTDRPLNYQPPVWLDDILKSTNGEEEKHWNKLFATLEKLQEAGYTTSEKTSTFFFKKSTWLGHEINEQGIKPKKEKIKAFYNQDHGHQVKSWNHSSEQCHLSQNLPSNFQKKWQNETTVKEENGVEFD